MICATFTFKVESAYVRVESSGDCKVGEPLNVSGTTNREPGTIITVSTFQDLRIYQLRW
ncbi:MAG: hypothetical protein MW690_000280 [Methanophagales archaeon]|nr:hypothetical protein [Methanophagales archaeon]